MRSRLPPAPPDRFSEFKDKPDYEKPMDANKDNVYEVTIKVFDGEATTTKDVTVKVTNKQEDGKVVVAPVQARIGIELTDTLTDSDIVTYGPKWQWQRRMVDDCMAAATTDDRWISIHGANSGHLHAAVRATTGTV